MSQLFILTGAAGFIGSHLAEALLARGDRVVGIDNFDPFYSRELKLRNLTRLESPAFEFHEADICDTAAMNRIFKRARPHGLFHIAALAGVRPSIENPARYTSVNLDGLVSVLDAARNVGCRHVAFASSSSVYGNNEKVPFAETDAVDHPISPYAATKRAGELTCRVYADLFDMSIVALRFFTVFGPGQRPDLAISKFMARIAGDEEIPMFGDGRTSRDYTFIDDIIHGVLAAYARAETMQRDRFRIYNLGGSQPVTLLEMIDTIAAVVGRPAHVRQLPMQPGDVQRTYADLTRAQHELGYQPKTPFRDGLERQWRWLRGAAG